MSWRVSERVWINGPNDRSELLVLLAIAEFASDGGECWPSMAKIAERARMTERGVRKIVRRLEADGYLSVEVGGGRFGCSKYTINPERHTGNVVPVNLGNPERECTKPGTGVHETRNSGSAEPSRTVNEPSPPTPRSRGGSRRFVGVPEGTLKLLYGDKA